MIYAKSDTPPSNAADPFTLSLPYHTTRGGTSLRLRAPDDDPANTLSALPPDTPLLHMDFQVLDHLVPEAGDIGGLSLFGAESEGGVEGELDSTSYWCKVS